MADIFDEILDLEGGFYAEGYNHGWKDGLRAGRIEGRSLGMERGFEKFLEAGRLYGKSLVWTSRLSSHQERRDIQVGQQKEKEKEEDQRQSILPPLAKSNTRLEKNILVTHDLMEPETLPTRNSDEAVEDVDDRIRKAQGKVRIIERHIGEVPASSSEGVSHQLKGKNESIEDTGNLNNAVLSET